ncbi:hypothetical protein [Zobellia galactanivorans]|uniref:Asparagine synthetase domain-containing protein n=1 Tax=Zobellia galactanivorans (strain DSM 12802 / CCUG 47099 / CIP 106680 / NCIMB 13871 / Dsij) TaxID=63186 RepID=G0L831_ZOBGA|nr:hypothetical protein [Zobellia galactanivorans]CAZ97902.1 Conserved hypothetical protein [Zobellia galactanivorans]
MSKIICAHFKNPNSKNTEKKLISICKKIAPNNITPNPTKILYSKSGISAIMNPMKTLSIFGDNILLGNAFSGTDKPWHSCDVNELDGSFAIFRNTPETSECITDSVATRTIWYYFDSHTFLASTSQRAIILFLESFEFNDQCIPWMLSTGSLGPVHSWDKRINRIPPYSSLTLDKKKWTIKINTKPIFFKSSKKTRSFYKKQFYTVITNTIKNSKIDLSKWTLPLSGGYDSRGLLFFLLKSSDKKPKTITWGLKSSRFKEKNDAFIAKEVAKALNVSNKYYHTDLSNKESTEDIFNRFILNGEGRVDHIGGYMDGFHIWKTLFENNVEGTIRGDVGFGLSRSVSSEINVRYAIGMATCSDYINLNTYCKQYNLPFEQIPSHLNKKANETLEEWRDRLYHQFRIPTILAALSDLKLGYVEQATPFLSNKILELARSTPDNLRTKKKLFKEIVNSFEPKLEYATQGANENYTSTLKKQEVVEVLKAMLVSSDAKKIFPTPFLDKIEKSMKTEARLNGTKTSKKDSMILYAKKITPNFVKKMIAIKQPYLSLDNNLLAFRIYIITYMFRLLHSEVKEL